MHFKMIYLKVPKYDAEKIRIELLEKDILHPDYSIFPEGGFVYFPLKYKLNFNYDVVEIDGIKRKKRKNPYELVLEKLNFQGKELLKNKWEKFGNVLIITIPKEIYDHRFEIGKAFAEVFNAKSVLNYRGVYGELRIPEVEFIYGNDAETIHVENGIFYKFDASKIMFSSGNVDERIRMSKLNVNNENIVDMFAGIGYFSIPLAKYGNPKEVIACEKNETAFRYLNENVKINNVKIKTILGDNRDLDLKDYADRIIMGYVHTSKFIPKAIDILKNEGIIHYHDTWTTEELKEKEKTLDSIFKDVKYEVRRFHVLKSYAPHIWHIVADVFVRK